MNIYNNNNNNTNSINLSGHYNSSNLKTFIINNLTEAHSVIDLLQSQIIRLEKENYDLKVVKDKYFLSEKLNKDLKEELLYKNKELDEAHSNISTLNTNLKNLELKKNEEIRDIKFDKDNFISNTEQKLSTLFSLEKLKDAQHNDIQILIQEKLLMQLEHKKDMSKLQYDHKNKLDELKKNMLERIKNKDRNVSQVNLENMDVSTKLTLLQNHQLLIELEYQSQQIQDLIVKKEALERRLFELDKDIEIHREVEHVLAEKNKKLSNTLKNVIVNGEKGRDALIGTKSDFTKSNNSLNILSKEENKSSLSKKYQESNLVISLEQKLKKLEKKLSLKELDYESLRINYDNLRLELERYNDKSKFILLIILVNLNNFKRIS